MRGLKTQESGLFNRYFQLIQDKAEKQGSVFFAFAGEGRDFELPDMEGEDLTGWLIPKNKVEVFEPEWSKENSLAALEEWEEYFVWAEWSIHNGRVSISFESY